MSPVPIDGALAGHGRVETPHGLEHERRLAGKKPEEVAGEFEAVLMAQMVAAMRRTVPSSGLLGPSGANRVLDGAFDHELARTLTARSNLGIGRQLVSSIERQNGTAAAAVSGTSGLTASGVVANGGSPGTLRRGRAGAGYRLQATSVALAERAGVRARVAPPTLPTAPAAAGPGGEVGIGAVTPVEGRVTSSYGVRQDPITGVAEFHGGIDLAAPRGARVRAVAAGEVVFSGRRGRAGNVVEVRHDDGTLVSTYAHVDRRLVRAGQKVAAGDVLATVGASGRTTGPHLHFAVKRDGQAIDPTEFLEPAPLPAAGAVRYADRDGGV